MKRFRRLIALLVILFLLGATVYFLTSSKFSIQTLRYEGNQFIATQPLKKKFDEFIGKNFVAAYFMMIGQTKWLKAFPEAEHFKFKFHSIHDLSVVVTEKKPTVAFITGKHMYLVSSDGVILNRNAKNTGLEQMDKLIIIRGISEKQFNNPYLPAYLLANIQKITTSIGRFLPSQPLQIVFDGDDNLTILQNDTLPIKIGSLQEIDKKFGNLKKLIQHVGALKETEIEYIDLRAPNRVIVKKIP